MKETIVAISTGSSSGAISIVRMSGDKSIKIADRIFKTKSGKMPSEFEARFLTLGEIKTQNFKEQAMCVVFKAPKSYYALCAIISAIMKSGYPISCFKTKQYRIILRSISFLSRIS